MNWAIYRIRSMIFSILTIGIFSVCSSNPVLAQAQAIADQLIPICEKNGIKTIVVSKLFHNGGSSDQLTNGIRDDLTTALVNVDTDINIIDATVETLIEKEKTFQLSTTVTESLPADAILVGDILTIPEIPEGICILRLISFRDRRIIAAPIVRFHLTDNSSGKERNMPYVLGMEKLSMKKLRGRHIALSDLGNLKEDNSTKNRLAYAEVVAAMVRSGLLLYEREFFYLTEDEVKRRGAELTFGDTDSVMAIRSRPDGKIDISVSERETSILLFRSVLSFNSNPVPDRYTTEGLNQLRSTGKTSFFRTQGAKVTYTVRIGEQMSIDDDEVDAWLDDSGGNTAFLSISTSTFPKQVTGESNFSYLWFKSNPPYFAPSKGCNYTYDGEAQLRQYQQFISGYTGNNKRAAHFLMILGLLKGFFTDEDNKNAFPGIFRPLERKIYSQWTILADGSPKEFLEGFPGDLLEYIYNPNHRINYCHGFPKGVYRKGDIVLNYELKIRWQNNVPAEVAFTVDLDPMKSQLFSVTKKGGNIDI